MSRALRFVYILSWLGSWMLPELLGAGFAARYWIAAFD